MALQKIVKNTTGSEITLDRVGLPIDAGSSYFINVIEYLRWADPEAITEITPYINSGDIVINDGTIDLPAAAGIRFLEYADRAYLLKDGTGVVTVCTEINLAGSNLAVVNDGNGRATITSNPQNSVLGKESGYEFFNNGSNVKDKWFDIVGASIPTDDTPGVITGNGKVRALWFSNAKDNTNIDIEIYRNGIDPGDLVYTWPLRDCRTAWKTNGLGGITFAIGDEIRMFAKDASGANPTKAVVKIILLNTDDVTGEGCRATLI